MRTLRYGLAVFVLLELAVSWEPAHVSGQDYYTQQEQNKNILKDAVVGAGVGAVASGASGGSAGKGALIGAGTNVIGSALVDTLTSPQAPQAQPQVYYAQQAPERGYTVVENPPRNSGCGKRA